MAIEEELRDSWHETYSPVPVTASVHRDIRSRARRQNRRQVTASLAVTAVAATVAVTGLTQLGQHTHPLRAPTLNPAAGIGPVLPTLESLAAHVAALPAEPQPMSGDWYVGLSITDSSHPDVTSGAQWWGPNGEMRQVLAGEEAPADNRELGPSWASLQTLPADPNKLAAQLRAATYGDALDNPELNTLSNVELYLSRTPAGPRLRADVIAAIATIPGIKIGGFGYDSLGRKGLAVSAHAAIHGEGYTERILISVTSGRLIEGDSAYGNQVVTTYTSPGAVPNDHTTPNGVPAVVVQPSSG